MGSLKLKAFLDTNVLLDVLCAPARPSAEASAVIFQAVRSGYIEGMITTQSIVDASYILSRCTRYDAVLFGQKILSLLNYLNVDGLSSFDIRDALLHPGGDFEDDVQFACADAAGCDVVVTSDRKFRQAPRETGMLFFTPEAFVARLKGD